MEPNKDASEVELAILASGASPVELFGHKAANLGLLRSLGLLVPDAVFLSEHSARSCTEDQAKRILKTLSPNTVIVRSSGFTEDSARESLAGHFLSIRAEPTPSALVEALRAVSSSGEAYGVGCAAIVQHWVDPVISGVAFSIDPLTFEDSPMVNWTHGSSERLLSGEEAGSTLSVSGADLVGDDVPAQLLHHLPSLVLVLKRLETRLKHAVDVEWCIDKQGALNFVQVRPVVLPAAGDTLLDEEGLRSVPSFLNSHAKIRTRRVAKEHAIPMPSAVLHIRHRFDSAGDVAKVSTNGLSAATTVVLLHPFTVDDLVVREFSGTAGAVVDEVITACQRYSIRRYPRFLDVTSAVLEVLEIGMRRSFVTAAMDGQILHAHSTGVFSQSDDGYVLEVARGHFVPKGVVSTSQFLFDGDGALVRSNRREQPFAVHFVDGRVVYESPVSGSDPLSNEQVALLASPLRKMVDAFSGHAVEFGITDPEDPDAAFLIDLVDAPPDTLPGRGAMESGGIAYGQVMGALRRVDINDSGALDAHFHSTLSTAGGESNPSGTVFLAESDSLSLLPLVRSSVGQNVGFIFERASVLSHLSIVLRELGIPAGISPSSWAATEGSRIELSVNANGVHIHAVS